MRYVDLKTGYGLASAARDTVRGSALPYSNICSILDGVQMQ